MTPSAPAEPVVRWDDDTYDGTCNICGAQQRFVRGQPSLREGYHCVGCRSSLRYRGQAAANLAHCSRQGSETIAELMGEPHVAGLAIWEPGVLGPFRRYFGSVPGYITSAFWPDVVPGEERDGIRCEDLMALTFADESFDLVVTSDVFEHVRKPLVGFAEVHRVLRPGGRHVFSIPVQQPLRTHTVARVDVSGDEDVLLVEARHHNGHLVYNDFGADLVGDLDALGFDTEVTAFESANPEAARLLSFCSTKR